MMIDSSDFMSSITVKRASRHDEGQYRIVAKNQWGSAEATFNVRVMGKHYNPKFISLFY